MNNKKLSDICRRTILSFSVLALFLPALHAREVQYKTHTTQSTSHEELLPELAGYLKHSKAQPQKTPKTTKATQNEKIKSQKNTANNTPVPSINTTTPVTKETPVVQKALPVVPKRQESVAKSAIEPKSKSQSIETKTEPKELQRSAVHASPLPENLSAPEHSKTISQPLPPLPKGPFSQSNTQNQVASKSSTASKDYTKPSYELSDIPLTSSYNKSPSWLIKNSSKLGLHHPVALKALELLGVPYKWGGIDEQNGLDCSGFVIVAYEEAGLDLPRTAAQIAQFLTPLPKEKLTPGDLVFFNTRGFRYSHVGVYLGNNLFAHAPRKGTVARIDDLSDKYWSARFNGGRKTPDPKM